MIPDEAVEAAAKAFRETHEAAHKAWREQTGADGGNFDNNLRAALEAAAPHIAAQALEDVAAAVLTNDPLDFMDQHLPLATPFQEATSLWLKAHARGKLSVS